MTNMLKILYAKAVSFYNSYWMIGLIENQVKTWWYSIQLYIDELSFRQVQPVLKLYGFLS